MAHIHKQLTIQNNDIIDPEDFNADMRELTGEFNGMLDRDNVKEQSIVTSDVEPNGFTRVYSFTFNDFKVENKTTSYQTALMSYSFESNHDGLLICEFSGEVHFENPPSASNSISATAQFLSLQMTINGLVVGEVFKTSAGSFRHPVYMVGAFPISPGRVTVAINGRTADSGHTDQKLNVASSNVNIPSNELVMIHRKR